MKFIKPENIGLPLAIWCVNDTYDYDVRENYFSATELLGSVKQIVLSRRDKIKEINIIDMVNAKRGTAIHDSIEKAWTDRLKENLLKLEINEEFDINPEKINPNRNVVFIEQRSEKKLLNYIIGGKFDMILNGVLHDFKSTSTLTYKKGNKIEDYRFQCSVYAWLNQDKITSSKFGINYIFTDWSEVRYKAEKDSGYPEYPILTEYYDLIPYDEIEEILKQKILSIQLYSSFPEEEIPDCNDKELWRDAPQYKYYTSNPLLDTSKKCQKKFDNIEEANSFLSLKGKGVVLAVQSEPKKCPYCKAWNICKQRKRYYMD